MMIESFRPTANTIDLPTQQALPTPPAQENTVVTPSSSPQDA